MNIELRKNKFKRQTSNSRIERGCNHSEGFRKWLDNTGIQRTGGFMMLTPYVFVGVGKMDRKKLQQADLNSGRR